MRKLGVRTNIKRKYHFYLILVCKSSYAMWVHEAMVRSGVFVVRLDSCLLLLVTSKGFSIGTRSIELYSTFILAVHTHQYSGFGSVGCRKVLGRLDPDP